MKKFCGTIESAVEEKVISELKAKEAQIDQQLQVLDSIGEDDIATLRERRRADLQRRATERQRLRAIGHGTYTELFDQQDFFNVAKLSKLMVAHFYRPSTWRCDIVDKHLDVLAGKHISTRFVKINAEKAQFLAERLKIWCIPTMMIIIDGKTSHSILGFDELGGDNFTTPTLEKLLAKHKVIEIDDDGSVDTY